MSTRTYYPILLQLEGWRCLVIGGGAPAEEKVAGLLEVGAQVTVIAETVTPALESLARSGRIRWLARACQPGDLAGFQLAISAAPNRSRNPLLAAAAERLGVLFNALDDAAHCRFIFPSVHRSGDLIVAISTSGSCPALAVRLRQKFARQLGPHYAAFLAMMASLRQAIAAAVPDFEHRRRLWYRLVDSPALSLLEQGDVAGARAAVESIVHQARQEVTP